MKPGQEMCLAASALIVSSALLAGCRQPDDGSRTQEAGEVASKYIDAIGGREAVTALNTIHTIDSLYMAGLGGTSEAWWTRDPFAGRITVRVGPVSQDLLISGDSVWSVDRNGALTSGDEMARAQAALAGLTVFQSVFLDPGSYGLESGPDTIIDGTGAIPLDFEAGGMPVTFYLSTETWLPVLLRTETMGMEVLSRPGGYSENGGVLFPGFTSDSIPALGQATRSKAVLVECNVPIADSVFMIAAGAVDAELPEPGRTFPFDLDSQHIYIGGTVCGHAADILLDSGAGATVLDSGLAAELGLESVGEFSALGVGGMESFGFAEVPEYSALGATTRGQTLALMPLDANFFPATGHHIGLILGYDFLSRFVTMIDYGNRTICLHERGSFVYGGPGSVIPATRVMSLLAVDAVLEDSIPLRLLLDTGAGGSIHLSSGFFERHPSFLDGRETLDISVQGIAGESGTRIFRAGDIILGGHRVQAGVCSELEDIPLISSFDGIVGTAVLARFRVWLDYGSSVVILEESSLFEEGLPEDMSGLGVETDGVCLIISEIVPGSAADEAGLLEGDRMVSMDGVRIGGDPALFDSLIQGEEGEQRVIVVVRGSIERTVTLALRPLLQDCDPEPNPGIEGDGCL